MALHPTTVISVATYNQNFLPKYTTGKIIAVLKDCVESLYNGVFDL